MIDLEWLAHLFDGMPGMVEVRCFWTDPVSGASDRAPFVRFCETPEQAALVLEERALESGWNCYVAMATRRDSSGGGKDNLAFCRVLWVDLDFLRADAAEAFDLALREWCSVAPPPSLVVDSGGGRHLYWMIEGEVPLDTPARIEWWECALKGLQVRWRHEAWEADPKVVDAARILRVPGTTNWPDAKKRGKGRTGPVSCVMLDAPARLYQPRDFAVLHTVGKLARAPASDALVPPAAALPERVRAVLESSPRVRALYLHDPSALPSNRKDPSDVSGSVFDWHLMCELVKHATLTKIDIITACQQARIRAGEDASKAKRVDYWERTWKGVQAQSRHHEAQPAQDDAAAQLRGLIRNPSAGRAGPITAVDLSAEVDPTHRYPSGIDFIDSSMGGLYGLTAVGGSKGVGKSTFLLNISLATAQAEGWTVAYFDSENAGNVWNRRVLHRMGQPIDVVRSRLRNLHRHWIDSGVTLGDLKDWICAMVTQQTQHLLVVIDSLNTFIDKATIGGADSYFGVYKELLLWMQDVRVATHGRVGFLMASELALKGNLLGGKIDYTLDCEVRVQEEDSGALSVFIEKSRETRKPEVQLLRRTEDFRLIPNDQPTDAPEHFAGADDGDRNVLATEPSSDEPWWQR